MPIWHLQEFPDDCFHTLSSTLSLAGTYHVFLRQVLLSIYAGGRKARLVRISDLHSPVTESAWSPPRAGFHCRHRDGCEAGWSPHMALTALFIFPVFRFLPQELAHALGEQQASRCMLHPGFKSCLDLSPKSTLWGSHPHLVTLSEVFVYLE